MKTTTSNPVPRAQRAAQDLGSYISMMASDSTPRFIQVSLKIRTLFQGLAL
ncbi:MAG: hypothetical protein AAGA75_07055 [Cyanobacteria bacterium P01_E01_bin.6]